MSIEERGREYMDGWQSGADDAWRGEPATWTDATDDHSRGYIAGRAAYLAAEQAERERLGRERLRPCSQCTGRGGWINALDGLMQQCPACHGTGRRS